MLDHKFKVGDYVKIKALKCENIYSSRWLIYGARVNAAGFFEGEPHYCIDGSTSFWCETDLENKGTNL